MSSEETITLFYMGRKMGVPWKQVLLFTFLILLVIANTYLPKVPAVQAILLASNILAIVAFAPSLVNSGMQYAQKAKIPTFFLGLVVFPLLSAIHEIISSAIMNIKAPILAEIVLSQQFSNKLFEMVSTFGIIAFVACKGRSCVDIKHNERSVVLRNGIFMAAIVSLLTILLVFDRAFVAIDGILLVISYLAFLVVAFIYSRIGIEQFDEKSLAGVKSRYPTWIDFAIMAFYILVIAYLGSNVSDNAQDLFISIPDFQKYAFFFMGMAFAAPNFVISLIAVRRGETALSIGYAVGSVIFELTISTSVLAFTGPIYYLSDATIVMLVVSLLIMALICFIYVRTHWTLRLWETVFIICTYSGAMIFIMVF
jgi:cation:H+ antiporter